MTILFIALASLLYFSQLYPMTQSTLSKKFYEQTINLTEVMESMALNLADEPNTVFENYKQNLEKNIERLHSICAKIKRAEAQQLKCVLRDFSKILTKYHTILERMMCHGYLYYLDYLKGTRALSALKQLALKKHTKFL